MIAYGLYLTFASAMCPASCLPSFLPLAGLAKTLGTDYSEVMIVIAVGAFIAHICEAATCVYFCKVRFKMQPATILLWGINVLIVGIFGENEKYYIVSVEIIDYILFRLLDYLISTQVPDNRPYLLQNTRKLLPQFVNLFLDNKHIY